MTGHYIEPEWQVVAVGGLFYYPTAGADIDVPIRVFSRDVRTFHFCDTCYERLDMLPPALEQPPSQVTYEGPARAHMERINGIRHLAPGKRIETYNRLGEAPLVIVRRRGFGQMGLAEHPPRSISVFMHRGDSRGEGGSNVWFFSNAYSRHPPLRNLFSSLQERLKQRALIVTDGSNTWKRFLNRFSFSKTSGRYAYAEHRGNTYVHGHLKWKCVGWLPPRYGPTLVWGVSGPSEQHDTAGYYCEE